MFSIFLLVFAIDIGTNGFCALPEHFSYVGIKNRERRQTEDCGTNCRNIYNDRLKTFFPNGLPVPSAAYYDPVYFIFTVKQNDFADICYNLYNPLDDCLTSCNDPLLKQFEQSTFPGYQHLCKMKYDSIFNAISCLQMYADEARLSCLQYDCNQLVNATENYMSALTTVKDNGDYAALKYFKSTNCRFVKCEAECSFLLLQRKCGLSIYSLLRNYVSAYYNDEKNVYYDSGSSSYWPDECNM